MLDIKFTLKRTQLTYNYAHDCQHNEYVFRPNWTTSSLPHHSRNTFPTRIFCLCGVYIIWQGTKETSATGKCKVRLREEGCTVVFKHISCLISPPTYWKEFRLRIDLFCGECKLSLTQSSKMEVRKQRESRRCETVLPAAESSQLCPCDAITEWNLW